MRANEFITETTTSGSIATVAMPLGAMQTRSNGSFFSGKYSNSATPNTPAWMKKLKEKKRVK
jgi:hypothetical protein